MYTKTLIPLDGSHSSEAAVEEALRFAPMLQSVHLVLVDLRVPPLSPENYSSYTGKISEARAKMGSDYLLPFRKRLEASGIDVQTAVLRGDPVKAIVDADQWESFDLILLGADGGWLERYFGPAHFANRLARRVDASVITVRNPRRRGRARARRIWAAPTDSPDFAPGLG